MSHRLRASSTRNRDARVLRHVDPLHVHAPACKVVHLRNRNQALDGIRRQNRSYSGNLRFSLKDLQNLTKCGDAGLTEVNREYSLHSLLGSHYNRTFSYVLDGKERD